MAAKDFAERINPRKFNFSPKLVAIVGAIIDFDYGVRDRKDGKLGPGLAITSDGFVTAPSTASDGGGVFIGDAADLERNISVWKQELSDSDRTAFEAYWSSNVTDWRQGGNAWKK